MRIRRARASMRIRRARTLPNGTCVGIDFSLTGCAACAIPIAWKGDMREVVQMKPAGYQLKAATAKDLYERALAIRDALYNFFVATQARHIMIEEYAFGASGQITKIADACGAMKLHTYENWGVVIDAIHASSARKVLLQKCPSKGAKEFVHRNVLRLRHTKKWSGDQVDAFVIANVCVERAGGTALSFKGT